MSGATNWHACLTRTTGGTCRCQPRCAVCGFGEHSAVHGPVFGQPPGSTPWGHAYVFRGADIEPAAGPLPPSAKLEKDEENKEKNALARGNDTGEPTLGTASTKVSG